VIQLPDKKDQNPLETNPVRFLSVSGAESGQRLDNYLMRVLQGVPKARVYRAIRKGEVRVNKGRAKPETKLATDDTIRIPPFAESRKSDGRTSSKWIRTLSRRVVLDERDLLVLDKPPGLAVHGGSGIDAGLIETLRLMYPDERYMELVHRLDRDTSGLIMIARRAATLRTLHGLLRKDGVDKRYQCLIAGRWPASLTHIDAPLEKYSLPSGERLVKVTASGKGARTEFRVLRRLQGATLIQAKPITGRTHQIRVHCRHAGFPILGDEKYSTPATEALTDAIGLPRLFLHAASLRFQLDGEELSLESPLPDELTAVLNKLPSGK
jgi:23S rRNA pseudouridine955/2504/2580 synthase